MPTPAALSHHRWTEADAREALAALAASGRSLRAFAREHGLDPQRLYAWRRKLQRPEPPRFVELFVTPPPPNEAVGLEIGCPSGHVVRVVDDVDTRRLVSVLRAIREAGC
jgi:transposase-like protein